MVDVLIEDQMLKDHFQELVHQTLAAEEGDLSEKSQDLFQDNNAVIKKKIKPYPTTRIKSRNFLSNISYGSVNDNDYIDRNFCFDTYVLLTKNINPFSLERKLTNQIKHEMIYMLSKYRMPDEFYKFISEKENFSYLNSKSVLYPKVSDIVWPL